MSNNTLPNSTHPSSGSEVGVDDGGPAFPFPVLHGKGAPQGMSLRDYFAAKSLCNPYTFHENSPDEIAGWAYQIADAMLHARGAK